MLRTVWMESAPDLAPLLFPQFYDYPSPSLSLEEPHRGYYFEPIERKEDAKSQNENQPINGERRKKGKSLQVDPLLA